MTDRQLPKWSELKPLLRPKPITVNATDRRLEKALTIADLRAIAKRRTPRSVFDYTDGAAEAEISLRRARSLFRRLEFQPSILHDVSHVTRKAFRSRRGCDVFLMGTPSLHRPSSASARSSNPRR